MACCSAWPQDVQTRLAGHSMMQSQASSRSSIGSHPKQEGQELAVP